MRMGWIYSACYYIFFIGCKFPFRCKANEYCDGDSPCIGFPKEKRLEKEPGEFDMYIIPVTVSTFSIAQMEVDFDFYILLEETYGGTTGVNRSVLPPAMEFRNCKRCTCVVDNITIVVSGQDKANWKKRHFGRFYCDFDLSNFPMDTQECSMQIVSNLDKINLKRDSRLNSEFKTLIYWRLPEYTIIHSRPDGECVKLPMTLDNTPRPCVQYLMRFKRKLSYHIFNIYCPSFLVVVLSWISFWLDPEMTSPRVALGLTPLLTLTTQLANIQRSLPPVSYIKASDVWMSTCIVLVFAALTELPLALYFERRNKAKRIVPVTPITPHMLNRNSSCTARKTSMQQRNSSSVGNLLKLNNGSDNPVDSICRIAFPVVFIVFNITYWLYYMLYAYYRNS